MRIHFTLPLAALLSVLLLTSCRGGASHTPESSERVPVADTAAMRSLAGIWVDEDTEAVVFCIRGDSVFYPDSTSLPVPFGIFDDTLVVDGVRYPILERHEYSLHYESLTGETIRLQRSDAPEDSLFFRPREYDPILLNEEVRRDTVVFSPAGERYHLYIAVNPTRYRVHQTTYTDEGLPMDNVFFDNIIHISVYQGRRSIFSRDFAKADFSEQVPAQFLEGALLSNMQFGSVDHTGCRFNATLCHPDGASCYVVTICVGYDGQYTMAVLEY